jgi:FemAB family
MIKYIKSLSELNNLSRKRIEYNFYYTESFRDYIAEKCQPIYCFDDNFIILVVLYKKFFFRYAQFPSEYLKLLPECDASPQEFLDSVVEFITKKYNIYWINSPNASALFEIYPTNSIRIPFGSHIVDLSLTNEEMWDKVFPKHKNMVRRAEKSNIIINFGNEELLEDYIKLDIETWKRSNSFGNGKLYYLNLIKHFPNQIVIAIAYKDGIPQGGGIFFYNKLMCYYMYGASKSNSEPGAMNLLHWKTILYMKEIGILSYSFVGCRINVDKESKYYKIQHFKKGFGGELKPCYLFKVINSHFYYKLFKILIMLRNFKNSKDAIDQEIHKWQMLNNH